MRPVRHGLPPSGTATVTATVITKAFDSSVTTSVSGNAIGDNWAIGATGKIAPTAWVIAPGGSATFEVTITPSALAGSVVRGTLYVDDLHMSRHILTPDLDWVSVLAKRIRKFPIRFGFPAFGT